MSRSTRRDPPRARAGAPAAPAPRRARPLHVAIACLAVGAAVAAAHWPVLRAQALSLDDNDFVTYNPLVTHPGWPSVGRFFGEVLHPSTVKGYYLPLAMTSLMLDYAAGGRPGNLAAFHRTSLALHAVNAMLVVLLLYRLFGSLVPAALAGLVFGLHPLTVEPVAWIGERKTLLATLFSLLSVLAYLRHCRRPARGWLWAALGLFVLALLSKPIATTLPLLLVILDYWPLRRLRLRTVAEKWAFFAVALAAGVVTLVSHGRTVGIAQQSAAEYLHWPLRAGYLLAFYLGKIAWPAGLSCVYPMPEPFSLANPAVLGGTLVVVALTAALLALRGRGRGALAGWLFFVVAIAPTLGLVRYTWLAASDRYVYFPALGLVAALGAALAAAWRSPALRAPVLAVVLAVCAAEAWGVRATLPHWRDSITLFRHIERIAPDSPAVLNELGILLDPMGQHEAAERYLRRAIERAPGSGDAYYNLGVVVGSQGRIEEAIRLFRRADEIHPDDPHTAYNLGAALRLEGKLPEAEAELRRALALQPEYPEAADLLGSVLVARGKLAEAVTQFRSALALAPENAQVRFRLAMVLEGEGGHIAESIDLLRQVVRARPDWAEPMNALAWILATSPDSSRRNPGEALPLAERAVQLTARRDPRVLDTQGAAQAAAGRFADAQASARDALALVTSAHADPLAAEIRQHLASYARGRAWVDRSSP